MIRLPTRRRILDALDNAEHRVLETVQIAALIVTETTARRRRRVNIRTAERRRELYALERAHCIDSKSV